MADSSVRGRFLWHELLTTDLKAAGNFFTKIASWKTEAWDQNPAYQMFVAKTGPMAGLVMLDEDARASGAAPHWLTYIGSPDAQETARQAVALGGKILKPLVEVPPVGRWVVLQDPQGAVFAAFTPSQTPSPESAPEIGDFSWHELATTNSKAAFDFYRALFGWRETSAMDMGPELGTYQMYGRGGAPLGGIYNKPKTMLGPAAWLPYLRVSDARATPRAIKAGGGHVTNGPLEVPGGDWITMGVDPQGGAFAVHSLKPAAVATTTPAPRATKSVAKVRKARKATARKAAKRKGQPKAAARGARKAKGARRTATAKRTRKAAATRGTRKATRPTSRSRGARKGGRAPKRRR